MALNTTDAALLAADPVFINRVEISAANRSRVVFADSSRQGSRVQQFTRREVVEYARNSAANAITVAVSIAGLASSATEASIPDQELDGLVHPTYDALVDYQG